MPLPNIIKIFQTIKKLWSAQEFGIEIHSGEITRKRIEQELSFLHATLLLDLICIPTYFVKLSQIVWELWPAQDFYFRVANYIRKKVSVVSLARDIKVKKDCLLKQKHTENHENRRLVLTESLYKQHSSLRGCICPLAPLKWYSIFKITRMGSMIPKEKNITCTMMMCGETFFGRRHTAQHQLQ